MDQKCTFPVSTKNQSFFPGCSPNISPVKHSSDLHRSETKARRHEWYRCIALWLGAPGRINSDTLVQVGCLEDERVGGKTSRWAGQKPMNLPLPGKPRNALSLRQPVAGFRGQKKLPEKMGHKGVPGS